MRDGNQAREEQSSTLKLLASENAVEQLRHRNGLMATLGSENGELKLDWVEGVARLLADPDQLEEVEVEAIALWNQGIRHIIWAGMGGSVITVRVLADLGFCDAHGGENIAIYPLDSTDPAALNTIIQRIAQAKKLTLPSAGQETEPIVLRSLFSDVMMIGVSMGMTSEEPITHLTWFAELLEQTGLATSEHILVMTLPGSYLDHFAHERQAPSRPLQLDRGTGTGGRMSAPGTRVFLLPAALYLTRLTRSSGQLRATLQQAWQNYNLDLATTQPAAHPYVQLAAAASAASVNGACRLLIGVPHNWRGLITWIEQLMEESLGKAGKGLIIFYEQTLATHAPAFHSRGTLHVHLTAEERPAQEDTFYLYQPSIAASDPQERLISVATNFLGWQLTMALYGYLHHITFAGQPAVENYKAGARALRVLDDPLQAVQNWEATIKKDQLILLAPRGVEVTGTPASIVAHVIEQTLINSNKETCPGYLDFTINGEVSVRLKQLIADHIYRIGNELLGVPVKLRQAPADYHSTEQGEMDGPACLVSLRLLLREHDEVLVGTYSDGFLRAQAVSTWQAMIEQGRLCFLLIIDGTLAQAIDTLQCFFEDLEKEVSA